MGGTPEVSRQVRHQVDEMRPAGRDVLVRRIWDPSTERLWRIWEMAGRSGTEGADASAEASLVLDGGDVVRRIAPLPADWARCSDAELLTLAHSAPLGRRWREQGVSTELLAGGTTAGSARADHDRAN
jgi:hypothetical protein